MKITFLMHSSFLVELDNTYLLFDYFEGERQPFYKTNIKMPVLDKNKELYAFASHSHADHYSLELFKFSKEHGNTKFILSKDIRCTASFLEKHNIDSRVLDNTLFVKPGKKYEFGSVSFETLFSTDVGVAYLIECEGKTIYHAGDLNWWHWENESDLEQKNAKRHYQSYLKGLKGRKIDLAFVPYDVKLNRAAIWGIEYFTGVANVQNLFPMHFWRQFDKVQNLKEKYLPNADCKIFNITKENEQFEL